MKRNPANKSGILLAGLCLTTLCARVSGLPERAAEADQLLAGVIAQLPPEPLHISGSLVVRQRRGVVLARYRLDCRLHWGGEPPMAHYRILNTEGHTLEELELYREPDGNRLIHRGRDRIASTAAIPLGTPIQATDLTWLDLTLDFLWWDHPVVTGTESVRGFDCVIVTVQAPSRHAETYAGVRLWIEPAQRLLLQAEGFDAHNRPVRRLWITSVQRVNEQWMIKEMEIQRHPSPQRTRMRIEEIIESEP